jgi:hypothetical protein
MNRTHDNGFDARDISQMLSGAVLVLGACFSALLAATAEFPRKFLSSNSGVSRILDTMLKLFDPCPFD